MSSLPDLLSHLKSTQTYDYIGASIHSELKKYFHNLLLEQVRAPLSVASRRKGSDLPIESVQFADQVIKINKRQKKQERWVMSLICRELTCSSSFHHTLDIILLF